MKYKPLGNTGVLVSEICLGAMTFGGRGFWKAIGEQPQDLANSIIKESIDHGINFIDTANAYSEGLSEIMLGKALTELGINRQEIVIVCHQTANSHGTRRQPGGPVATAYHEFRQRQLETIGYGSRGFAVHPWCRFPDTP